MDDYFDAKAALFTSARTDRAVVCVDDAWGRRMVERAAASGLEPTTYAVRTDADWTADAVVAVPGGSVMRGRGPDGTDVPLEVRLPGDFNVANALGALALLVSAGVDPLVAADGIAACDGVPGRMERVADPVLERGLLAFVDYAHTPDAVDRVVTAARDGARGKVVVVLGAGGDRDPHKREAMGEAAARGADVVIVTDDNPRSEDPAEIRAAVLRGAERLSASVVEVPDRDRAIHVAVHAYAAPGDVVLILGKGHEQGQEVAGSVSPFDDRVVLAAALAPDDDWADDESGRDRWCAMIPLTLEEIAVAVDGRLAGGADPDAVALGASTDSRAVDAYDLFVAVVGEHHDAHDHAASAIGSGAVAVLASRELDVPCVVVDDTVTALGRLARSVVDRMPDLVVVGITGSSGKTSTKDLLAEVLPAYGRTLAPEGSFNTEVGLPMTALRLEPRTRVLVAEMGARGVGHIRYLCGITPPRIGVVLNVGTAHVGEFGSREAIASSKGELVEALPHAGQGGIAVLNADDPLVLGMRSRTTARVVTYGENVHADVRADAVTLDEDGRASYDLCLFGRRAHVRLGLHGRHHVSNSLAVAAVGLSLGLDLDQVAANLTLARPASRWRMEVTRTATGATVVNDAYNANPESVRAALDALVAMGRPAPDRAARRTVAVLGEMRELGATSVQEHEEIGRTAVRQGVARLVVVGESADAVALADGARSEAAAAVGGDVEIVAVPDADAAVADLVATVRTDDVVLVKASRGVALERVVAGLLERTGVAP